MTLEIEECTIRSLFVFISIRESTDKKETPQKQLKRIYHIQEIHMNEINERVKQLKFIENVTMI